MNRAQALATIERDPARPMSLRLLAAAELEGIAANLTSPHHEHDPGTWTRITRTPRS